MVLKIKTDLPIENKIRQTAERIYLIRDRHKAYGNTPVYLIGYGAVRDWNSGISRTFMEYLSGLVPIPVPQDDHVRPGGYRPLMTSPRKLRINGASFGIIFETSTRGYIIHNGVFLPASPSQNGALIGILALTDIPHLTTSVTYDDLGIAAFPIEPSFAMKRRFYLGPRRFLDLNLIDPEVAARMQREHVSTEEIEKRIKEGGISPNRLKRYEEFLRARNMYEGKIKLESTVLEGLDRICEPEPYTSLISLERKNKVFSSAR